MQLKRTMTKTMFFISLAICFVAGNTNADVGKTTALIPLELLDPSPHAGDNFGSDIVVLANGNIVVAESFDSSVAERNGAVHLYDGVTHTLIASLYGDETHEYLGDSIFGLGNNNFVVNSPWGNKNGIIGAGSVRLVSGTTGLQIGRTLAGETVRDYLGSGDRRGSGGITVLANHNFVVNSSHDDPPLRARIVDAGSVRLVSGTSGRQLGVREGGFAGARLGSGGIAALPNSNYVIASPYDGYHRSILNYGSVRLMGGTTGTQIGSAILGYSADDSLGSGGVTALANNNFVIASPDVDRGTWTGRAVDAGLVQLVNGTTGVEIARSQGITGDQFGSGGVTAMANNNFAFASPYYGDSDKGFVHAMNGTSGKKTGGRMGDRALDYFGNGGITALANNNLVISSPFAQAGGLDKAGSVQLVNGTNLSNIGLPIVGDIKNGLFGNGTTTALANNNYVIASSYYDQGGITYSGSVRLVNGNTGLQIGEGLSGDTAWYRLGSGGIVALANHNFVVISPEATEGGVDYAGSVQLVSGTTGIQIGNRIAGNARDNTLGAAVVESNSGDFFYLGLPRADKNGLTDSGVVRLIAAQ